MQAARISAGLFVLYSNRRIANSEPLRRPMRLQTRHIKFAFGFYRPETDWFWCESAQRVKWNTHTHLHEQQLVELCLCVYFYWTFYTLDNRTKRWPDIIMSLTWTMFARMNVELPMIDCVRWSANWPDLTSAYQLHLDSASDWILRKEGVREVGAHLARSLTDCNWISAARIGQNTNSTR